LTSRSNSRSYTTTRKRRPATSRRGGYQRGVRRTSNQLRPTPRSESAFRNGGPLLRHVTRRHRGPAAAHRRNRRGYRTWLTPVPGTVASQITPDGSVTSQTSTESGPSASTPSLSSSIGRGATVRSSSAVRRRLRAGRSQPRRLARAGASAHDGANAELTGVHPAVRTPGSVHHPRLAWVAAGRRAAYVTEGDLRDSVHFAAGIALCQAAGCIVAGLHGPPFTQEWAVWSPLLTSTPTQP
jgi:hypothetical protein